MGAVFVVCCDGLMQALWFKRWGFDVGFVVLWYRVLWSKRTFMSLGIKQAAQQSKEVAAG